MSRTLTHAEARAFYDRFAGRQDSQAFYEDAATRELIAHAQLGSATSVVEFGCGTGRFAAELLEHHLPPEARYLGVDVSEAMVALARTRLARFGGRVQVRRTDGSPRIEAPPGSADRFFSNYVLDLLSPEDTAALLEEARRLLRAGGLLGIASLAHGSTLASRVVERLWTTLFAIRPSLVGGCRPIDTRALLPGRDWRVLHHRPIVRFGIPSESLIAERLGS